MTRLFHTILPIPECCGSQMRLCGNLNLHEIDYQCHRCFRRVQVKATFTEDAKPEVDDATKAATDATP